MKVIYLFFICILMISCAPEGAQVYISTDVANIENEQVKVSFDLKNGYLQIINKQENRVIVDSACFSANQYYSTDFSLFKAHAEDTHTGKKLFVTACSPEIDLTVESTVMNNSPEIKFNMQILIIEMFHFISNNGHRYVVAACSLHSVMLKNSISSTEMRGGNLRGLINNCRCIVGITCLSQQSLATNGIHLLQVD